MKEIWIIIEHKDGRLRKLSLMLIGLGKSLAAQEGSQLCAVLLGHGVDGVIEELSAHGVSKIYVADEPGLKNYTAESYRYVIAGLVNKYNPKLVLFGHSDMGKDLAPRVAQRVGCGLVSDCVAVNSADGRLVFTRPVYAGKAFSKSAFKEKLMMASIRPNVYPGSEPSQAVQPEIIRIDDALKGADLKALLKEIVSKTASRVAIGEADIIVSGGRGMQKAENFTLLENLADVLGGAVGASRAAVDAGWRDYAYQVGQTGKVVSPLIYFAVGISGALQHVAGMSSARVVVAINKDPNANIFNVADYGIVGDLFEILPILTDEFRQIVESAGGK